MRNPVAKYLHKYNKAQVVACKRQKAKAGYRKHKQHFAAE